MKPVKETTNETRNTISKSIKRRGTHMDSTEVKKADVLAILVKNRAEHVDIFQEAIEGYRKEAVELLEGHIARIKAGKVVAVQVSLPQPENHTKDYDRVIKMLEMCVNDTVELDEHTFQCYVMDDWTWKRSFLSSNSNYSGKAMAAMAN